MTEFTAPCAGWVSALNEAPDPVFADAIMGPGILLDPLEGTLRAPCAGHVIGIARTEHAITVQSPAGAQLLLHVGLETVALKGAGFDVLVREGQKVAAATPLLRFDLDFLAEHAASLLSPMVIVNGEDFKIVRRAPEGPVQAGDFLFAVRRQVAPAARPDATAEGDCLRQRVVLALAHGLHARPAAQLARMAKMFDATVSLIKDGRSADACSPVSLMGLGAVHGDRLYIEARGGDAKAALEALAGLIGRAGGEAPAMTPGAATGTQQPPQPVAMDGTGIITGVCGAPGLVIGEAVHFDPLAAEVPQTGQGQVRESRALTGAMDGVRQQLHRRAKDPRHGALMQAHLALLDDPVLARQAQTRIEQGESAAFAWRAVCEREAKTLAALDDARLRERAADLRDLGHQVVDALCGHGSPGNLDLPENAVVLADELLPSQFLALAEAGMKALCMARGGPTSHVCIMAAERGLAVLVAAGPVLHTVPQKTALIVEADSGRVQVAPSGARITALEKTLARRRRNNRQARMAAPQACRTKDGARIEVFANLGKAEDAARACALGAEGCGLLRSELLFMGRAEPPGEAEQSACYQAVADGLDGRPLIIRTLDAGADKPMAFVDFGVEDNPALGLRGVRVSLRQKALLRNQLRAILAVRSSTPVQIMLPMVVDAAEILEVRAMLDEERAALGLEQPLALGIMVETPAAAIAAGVLARHADFFSIGSNDLTQYTLAMDRGNEALAARLDALHPAVLRLIKAAAQAGRAAGKSVGVCGAMAADLTAVPVLIGLGVNELSLAMGRIAAVKALVRTLDMADCREAIADLLVMESPKAVRQAVRRRWPQIDDWS